MRKLWLYLMFWWRSTNQHGIHSPFVFAMVTKCFYSKKNETIYSKLDNKSKDFKRAKFLCRFVKYFNFKTIYYTQNLSKNFKIALSSNPDSVVKIYSENVTPKLSFSKKDFFFFKSLPIYQVEEFKQLLEQCGNDSIVMIEDFRLSPRQFKYWKYLKSNPNVRVSIDTYFFGILCFRKEQIKEHFTIRL